MARLLRDAGFAAEKSSRSGCSAPDISVPLLGIDRKVECKVRADGFAQIYGWIDRNFALVIKRDRDTPLDVTRLSDSLHRLRVVIFVGRACLRPLGSG
jgi:hypothetical protein